MSFKDLEKAYGRINTEALWQVLRTYDVDGKHLNGIKTMCVNSLDCVKVKRVESECFRIDSGMKQGCIMSPWLFSIHMDAVKKEVKVGIGRRGVIYKNRKHLTIFGSMLREGGRE